jgi:hypothetical protein
MTGAALVFVSLCHPNIATRNFLAIFRNAA